MEGKYQGLKDYLSASTQKSPNQNVSSSTSTLSSWFSRSSVASTEPPSSDEDVTVLINEAQNDPCLPALSKKQRIIGFFGCLLMGTFCFSLASLYIPFLVVKARKFALLYTLGSLFIIFSFSLLWGPMKHLKGLLTYEKLPFTSAYFGTMFATLYFSLWVKSTIFTVIFAAAQIVALIWYIISYIPGGQSGLTFFSKIFYSAVSRTASKTLPV